MEACLIKLGDCGNGKTDHGNGRLFSATSATFCVEKPDPYKNILLGRTQNFIKGGYIVSKVREGIRLLLYEGKKLCHIKIQFFVE